MGTIRPPSDDQLQKTTELDQLMIPGTVVRKTSGKPFKSGEKLATVLSRTVSPVTGRLALTSSDCEGFVEILQCEIVRHP